MVKKLIDFQVVKRLRMLFMSISQPFLRLSQEIERMDKDSDGNTSRTLLNNPLLHTILLDVPFITVDADNIKESRLTKRAIQREVEKITPSLYEVDEEFYKELFSDQNEFFSYHDLYITYLNNYLATLDRIHYIIKPRHINLYEHHFADMYKPLEKEP